MENKKKRGNPNWRKGVSANPKGAPKRGQSWSELIALIGNLTPAQAAERAGAIGERIAKYSGDNDLTLKELVVLRVYDALLFDPQPGLLNAYMERVEGKVREQVEHSGTFTINVTGTKWKPNDNDKTKP